MTDTDIKALVERLRNNRDPLRCFGTMEDAADALEALQAEREEASGYAERLAVALWEKHWRDDAPQWKPLTGDLIGILTQIDNSVADLSRAEQAKNDWNQPVKPFIAELEEILTWKARAEKAEAALAESRK